MGILRLIKSRSVCFVCGGDWVCVGGVLFCCYVFACLFVVEKDKHKGLESEIHMSYFKVQHFVYKNHP